MVYAREVSVVLVKLSSGGMSQMLVPLTVRRDSERGFGYAKLPASYCQEIIPKVRPDLSVPKTDTGGRDEYSKALEITIPKELYKIAP